MGITTRLLLFYLATTTTTIASSFLQAKKEVVEMKKVEFFSVRDTAKLLGVSLKFMYDLIWAGKLEATKVGKVWQIPSSAVERRLRRRGE
jgi:excisionase family DNA binding protein